MIRTGKMYKSFFSSKRKDGRLRYRLIGEAFSGTSFSCKFLVIIHTRFARGAEGTENMEFGIRNKLKEIRAKIKTNQPFN
jgi:hypothetical protein